MRAQSAFVPRHANDYSVVALPGLHVKLSGCLALSSRGNSLFTAVVAVLSELPCDARFGPCATSRSSPTQWVMELVPAFCAGFGCMVARSFRHGRGEDVWELVFLCGVLAFNKQPMQALHCDGVTPLSPSLLLFTFYTIPVRVASSSRSVMTSTRT